ncbi:MAG: hypothetical protein IPF66_25200 [Holophagales bacterium]|nr:hypothetical protein [Holophagales bacterium]
MPALRVARLRSARSRSAGIRSEMGWKREAWPLDLLPFIGPSAANHASRHSFSSRNGMEPGPEGTAVDGIASPAPVFASVIASSSPYKIRTGSDGRCPRLWKAPILCSGGAMAFKDRPYFRRILELDDILRQGRK